MSLVSVAVAWAVYLGLHSLLAAEKIKTYFYQKGVKPQSYRLIYSLFAFISLLPVLVIMGASDKQPLFDISEDVSRYIGLALATFGILIARQAFQSKSLATFLGFKAAETPNSPLITDGIYAKVRHPLYSGLILILLGMLVYINTFAVLVSVICLLLYLPLGIYWEEQKLLKGFGKQYHAYRKKVKAIIPWVI